jgi:hypothetical protein
MQEISMISAILKVFLVGLIGGGVVLAGLCIYGAIQENNAPASADQQPAATAVENTAPAGADDGHITAQGFMTYALIIVGIFVGAYVLLRLFAR